MHTYLYMYNYSEIYIKCTCKSDSIVCIISLLNTKNEITYDKIKYQNKMKCGT